MRKVKTFITQPQAPLGVLPARQEKAPAPDQEDSPVDRRIGAQLLGLLRALGTARRHRHRLALLAAALVAVVCAVAFGQIRLNAWNGAFYDLLARRSFGALGGSLLMFLAIAGGLLLLVVTQTWLQEMIKVGLREWLTHDLLDSWLARRRPYLLSRAGEIGANPDQYIQADAKQLAELLATLGFGLLQSTLLLVSFASVLWVLSGQVVFTFDSTTDFTIPGYMLWCALIYALAGSWLAWLVGRPLVRLNAERYAREADLRSAVVRIHEHAEAIALQAGEADERRAMGEATDRVVGLSRQIAKGVARLTWITSGYGWLAIVVPLLVALPGYMFGNLSLGGLMMVIGAFNQVQQALRWFVDNVSSIADWRATLLRVAGFREALLALDAPQDKGHGPAALEQIAVEPHPEGRLAFENLALLLPEGRAMLETPLVEIERGERVLIAAGADSGKRELLRAAAGLAVRGAGTILLPPADRMMVLPPRPYLPYAPLYAAIAYPAAADGIDEAALVLALERVGLAALVGRLGDTERWDRVLSPDEQQRVNLARLLLEAPAWLFLEEAMLDADEAHGQLARSILQTELADATVIAIGSSTPRRGFYTRRLQLRSPAALPHPRFRQQRRAAMRDRLATSPLQTESEQHAEGNAHV